jgi:hypothetical protein
MKTPCADSKGRAVYKARSEILEKVNSSDMFLCLSQKTDKDYQEFLLTCAMENLSTLNVFYPSTKEQPSAKAC